MFPSLSRTLRSVPALAALALCALPAAASAGTLHAYATLGNETVAAFDVGTSGTLTANPAAAAPTAVVLFGGVVMTPDGTHLYAVSQPGNAVRTFDVLAGGGLTPNASPTVATGTAPNGMAISPDGAHVFVANSSSNTLSVFDVSPSGVLVPNPGSPVATGTHPWQLAITGDGKHLYVTDMLANGLNVFDIGAGGALAPNATPTASAPGLPNPIALTPDGGHAYVAQDSGGLTPFDITATGALVPNAMAPISLAGTQMVSMTVTPDSRHLLAITNGAVRELRVYDIAASGSLTANPGAPLPTNGLGFTLALTPNGAHAYTAEGGGTISTFDVGADGRLTAHGAPQPVAGGSVAVVVAPSQPASAAFGAQSGAPGEPTSFDASGSTDPDGSVARYDWDFGDGTTVADGGPNPSHAYSRAGTYTVTLRLTDDQGCSGALTWGGQMARCSAGTQSLLSGAVEVREPSSGSTSSGSGSTGSGRILPLVTNSGGATTLTDRGGTLTVPGLKAICTKGAGPCDDSMFAINATVRGRRVTLGRRALALADGAESPVALKLSAWGRRVLQRHRVLRVTAEAVLQNSKTGARAVYVKNLTLKAAPKAQKKTAKKKARR
jgi:YVTN family beta-propeller protein